LVDGITSEEISSPAATRRMGSFFISEFLAQQRSNGRR
jgi:hypothetical protein